MCDSKASNGTIYNICKGSSERGERMRALGVWVTAALPSHQSTSTRAGCQLEATYMTHLTPPLEPWLEIIGLFLQLNRWHTVPGWMSASLYTYYSQHICARCLPHLFSSYVLESKMSALCFLHRKIQAAHRQRLSCPMLFFFFYQWLPTRKKRTLIIHYLSSLLHTTDPGLKTSRQWISVVQICASLISVAVSQHYSFWLESWFVF